MTDIETVYRDYKGKVLGYLRQKVNNPTVAEDICSDVFVKITANIDRFDPEKSSISTWIYNITRNTLYDHFRTRHELGVLDETMAAKDDFVEKLCSDEMLETLSDALEALPDRERELIVRHYYNGEKLKDIAARFDISYSYIKLLHKSALSKLNLFLENH